MKAYGARRGPDTWTIYAEKLTKDNVDELAELCGGMKTLEHDALDDKKTMVAINVPGRGGNRRLSEGDYLIQGTNGDQYFMVLNGAIFEDTHMEK